MSQSRKPLQQLVLEDGVIVHNVIMGGRNGRPIHQGSIPVSVFANEIKDRSVAQRPLSFGPAPVNFTCKDIHQNNGHFVFLVERPPVKRTVKWLHEDSPKSFGPESTYREVTIALPWQYFFVTVSRKGHLRSSSVYFMNEQLQSYAEPLSEPHFYNCSVNSYGVHCWICTQYMQNTTKNPNQSFFGFVHAFISWFWASGFNTSSEAHEGNSFFGKNKDRISDQRVKSIKNWENASQDTDNFACTVPWVKSQLNTWDVFNQLTSKQLCPGMPETVEDFIALVQKKLGEKC